MDNDDQHRALAVGAVEEAVRAMAPDASVSDWLTTDVVDEAELAWLATGLLPNADLLSPADMREICQAIIGRTATVLLMVGWRPPARLVDGVVEAAPLPGEYRLTATVDVDRSGFITPHDSAAMVKADWWARHGATFTPVTEIDGGDS